MVDNHFLDPIAGKYTRQPPPIPHTPLYLLLVYLFPGPIVNFKSPLGNPPGRNTAGCSLSRVDGVFSDAADRGRTRVPPGFASGTPVRREIASRVLFLSAALVQTHSTQTVEGECG